MDFYSANLVAFCTLNAILLHQTRRRDFPRELPIEEGKPVDPERLRTARAFQRRFLVGYALVVGADWLQGPHIYATYKYEKGLSEEIVALLYATGFIASAISAIFAGQVADCWGRKARCRDYCILSAYSCVMIHCESLLLLFVGRVFGGMATTILFSVFEAWMIAEYHNLGLDDSVLPLNTVFRNMTLVSSIVAIISGVAGDAIVQALGNRKWPFALSILSATVASFWIQAYWTESYGTRAAIEDQKTDLGRGVRTVLTNKRILAIGIASCCFEGAMYLFVFFWSPALKSARLRAGSEEELPFGIIFASFMCAMMVGAIIFSSRLGVPSRESATWGVLMAMLFASASLSCAVLFDSERALFLAFVSFELCVGAYFPIMGFLKSELIEDGVRGSVYSLLRLPLNLFVVGAHSLAREGMSMLRKLGRRTILTRGSAGDDHRNNVFLTLAGLLVVASLVCKAKLA
ncbi:Molybdate-anion transporter [Tolypocladium ophioglossoides CBS 100239]|uniref:Molybdate-anion transporter n=1 Tax=Tolypocladium ophioglossoides (strain CBS 100239) TaxID=1163406 RepID=A0A0L0N7Q1_TOLOC|nr:Molybdate-anion transporter [Tolypocladium ophioglossoides CBS 100239]